MLVIFSWSHDGKYIYLTVGGAELVFARVRVPDEHHHAETDIVRALHDLWCSDWGSL